MQRGGLQHKLVHQSLGRRPCTIPAGHLQLCTGHQFAGCTGKCCRNKDPFAATGWQRLSRLSWRPQWLLPRVSSPGILPKHLANLACGRLLDHVIAVEPCRRHSTNTCCIPRNTNKKYRNQLILRVQRERTTTCREDDLNLPHDRSPYKCQGITDEHVNRPFLIGPYY